MLNRILNKVKWGVVIAGVLSAVKMFLPDVEVPEGLQDAILLIILFLSQFFIKETRETLSHLR